VSGTFTATTPAATPHPSIAVLPFANLSPDRENEYFADGLTDEIITDLSSIRALRVISRTSAMRFKSSERHRPSIAKELGVRFVLEGGVRRAGSNLRITAQLIDASEDTHLWGEKYTGSVEDVFAIQEEISRRIVTALKLRLTHSEERQIAARPIEDVRAYDCYLRARQEIYRWTPESLERAEALVRSALEMVGENALLLATEGHIQWMYVNGGIAPDESRLVRADECARRALALDPESYQAVFVRGIVAGLRGRLEDAVQDLVSAYQRNPGDANVLTEVSRFLFNAGRQDVLELTSRALTRVDPLTPIGWLNVVVAHTGKGRFADAVLVARHLMTLLDPYSPIWIHAAWQPLVPAGERAEAREILAQYATRAPSEMYRALARFLVAAIDGDAAAARQYMTPAVERAASMQEHLARVLGDAYAQLGHVESALRWLRASIDRGMIHYPLLTHDVLLDPIRYDPRFEELLALVKRRWEAFPNVTLA
jgi:TolB-like protein/Tfp pilus assembly protein PilF